MSEATYPADLLYHSEHGWARVEGDEATFGITWYAQDALGEVIFFDPPKVGTRVLQDQRYTDVESVKTVSELVAPLSGEVIAANEALADAPDAINRDPYGEGWLVRVRRSEPAESAALLTRDAYVASLH